MALADASDSNDDGNFEDSIANACVLRLTRELAWIEEALAATGLRGADSALGLADRVFANAISHAAAAAFDAYEGMLLREALKHGVYDLHTARCVLPPLSPLMPSRAACLLARTTYSR